ncbi:hypothetical protein HanXRQr2_Chr07g0316181 [Helianthus annuus]|uniref:Uncharacterized protein n=1 Tax=Helianthus annuus TaxID=4232 RepID=A0A9K3IQ55_HELAN|nr:hypothetical protein HanXRQr2_Chr07g0316181 [Helianthus annuus]KAJ0906441.1 hypothetical protein HanPSC8_Chr07g0305441 [Helianthus annuus]
MDAPPPPYKQHEVSTCFANSLVGKSTRIVGALPYPVRLVAFSGPFISDSNIGKIKASVLP